MRAVAAEGGGLPPAIRQAAPGLLERAPAPPRQAQQGDARSRLRKAPQGLTEHRTGAAEHIAWRRVTPPPPPRTRRSRAGRTAAP